MSLGKNPYSFPAMRAKFLLPTATGDQPQQQEFAKARTELANLLAKWTSSAPAITGDEREQQQQQQQQQQRLMMHELLNTAFAENLDVFHKIVGRFATIRVARMSQSMRHLFTSSSSPTNEDLHTNVFPELIFFCDQIAVFQSVFGFVVEMLKRIRFDDAVKRAACRAGNPNSCSIKRFFASVLGLLLQLSDETQQFIDAAENFQNLQEEHTAARIFRRALQSLSLSTRELCNVFIGVFEEGLVDPCPSACACACASPSGKPSAPSPQSPQNTQIFNSSMSPDRESSPLPQNPAAAAAAAFAAASPASPGFGTSRRSFAASPTSGSAGGGGQFAQLATTFGSPKTMTPRGGGGGGGGGFVKQQQQQQPQTNSSNNSNCIGASQILAALQNIFNKLYQLYLGNASPARLPSPSPSTSSGDTTPPRQRHSALYELDIAGACLKFMCRQGSACGVRLLECVSNFHQDVFAKKFAAAEHHRETNIELLNFLSRARAIQSGGGAVWPTSVSHGRSMSVYDIAGLLKSPSTARASVVAAGGAAADAGAYGDDDLEAAAAVQQQLAEAQHQEHVKLYSPAQVKQISDEKAARLQSENSVLRGQVGMNKF